MSAEIVHDRGRGPEIVGTRVTVYNLLPYFLDATASEAFIARVHGLSNEQVAAARAYVLNHADEVLAEHLRIEARIAIGNPPEVIEAAKRTRARFEQFRKWQAEHHALGQAQDRTSTVDSPEVPMTLPSFEEWLAAQPSNLRDEGR
ncbi:MAG: hypothetical protein K2Y37_03935 [Pirellulales bacterium]|nr:hypothetical protein [Pirellulales bacterium]